MAFIAVSEQPCCKQPHDCSNPLSSKCLYRGADQYTKPGKTLSGWERTEDIPLPPVAVTIPPPASDEMPDG